MLLLPRYPADQLTVAYLPSLADTLRAAGKHINGFFDGATAELADDHLTISLAHGGYEWLERENCARVISEILEQEFGRQITVEFTGVLDLESNQEIYRKTMEAAEAAIPKAPPRPAAPGAFPSGPCPERRQWRLERRRQWQRRLEPFGRRTPERQPSAGRAQGGAHPV